MPNFVWAKSFGGPGSDKGWGISRDGSGNLYVVGTFDKIATFGKHNISGPGSVSLFLAKLSESSGSVSWAKGDGPVQQGCAVATDSGGNSYITGSIYNSGAIFGALSVKGPGGVSDIFVAKADSKGTYVWAKAAGGTGTDSGEDVAVDSQGNVAVTGWFKDAMKWGTLSLSSAGGFDVFVARLDKNGKAVWAEAGGGSSSDQGFGVAIRSAAEIYVAGQFKVSGMFGSTTVNGYKYGYDGDLVVWKTGTSSP